MSDNTAIAETVREIGHAYLQELRRKRRWRILFRTLVLIVMLGLLAYSFFGATPPVSVNQKKPHIGLIDIKGMIASDHPANADNLAKSLRQAYKDKHLKAILLRINSPGGSPVQAQYAYNTVRRLRKKHPKINVYAVCTDMCTSAAYYIAAAADKVYAAPASMVGSIGVLFDGFGFVGAIGKLGVQRRLITAGQNKGFMDPFSPMNAKQKADLQAILNEVHVQFKTDVKTARGKRLKSNPAIFSGLFWTGNGALKLGLIDGIGSPGDVARTVIKTEYVVNYTVKHSYFERIAKRFGESVSQGFMATLGLTPHLR